MDLELGLLHSRLERPQTRKFAWPIAIIPELFTTFRHLTIMAGHLVSLGWEVYLLDIHPASSPSGCDPEIDPATLPRMPGGWGVEWTRESSPRLKGADQLHRDRP